VSPTVNTQAPSVANITYITITLSVGGSFQRNESRTNYLVNTTSEVSILGDGGSALFTVVPNANSSLRIGHFRVVTDIISLTHFRNILQFSDLRFQSSAAVGRNLRRNLVADGNSSLDLGLGRGQHIYIANLTEADLKSENFIFAQPQEVPAIGNMKETWGPLIAAITVSGCFVLFLIYKFGDMGREFYKTHLLKRMPTDWTAASRSNPTYLSFQDDSFRTSSSFSSARSSVESSEVESYSSSEDCSEEKSEGNEHELNLARKRTMSWNSGDEGDQIIDVPLVRDKSATLSSEFFVPPHETTVNNHRIRTSTRSSDLSSMISSDSCDDISDVMSSYSLSTTDYGEEFDR
jgi:hypothetical protein